MKQKEANLEALRILSMLFIIGGHCVLFTHAADSVPKYGFHYFTIWAIYALFFSGTNTFVLLSGYFYSKPKLNLGKIGSLYGTMLLYSVGLAIALIVSGLKRYSLTQFVQVATPFNTNQYWFMTSFIGLLFFKSILDYAIPQIDRKSYQTIILILFIALSVIPTVWIGDGMGDANGYSVVWFIFVYLVGAYIRRFEILVSRKYCMLLIACCTVLMAISKICVEFAADRVESLRPYSSFLYYNNTPPVLTISVALLVIFKQISITGKRLIKAILWYSSCCLGVYLIHMHVGLSSVYWPFVKKIMHAGSISFYLILIAVVILIFFVCTLIEKGRQFLAKKIQAGIAYRHSSGR